MIAWHDCRIDDDVIKKGDNLHLTSVEEDINDDDDDDGTDRLMDGSVFATRSVAVRPLAPSRKTPTENMLHTQTCDNNRNCGVA